MYMSDNEIAYSYRMARVRSLQIPILAQLNAVDVETMKNKLISLGFPEVAVKKKKPSGRPHIVDTVRLKELCSEGMSDDLIAQKLGVTKKTIERRKKEERILTGKD